MFQEQIIKCEEMLVDAMINSDVEALEKLLHDTLLFNIPNGKNITEAINIENYRIGILKVNSISTADRKIHIIENCAVVAVTFHLKAIFDTQPTEHKFRYIRVWKIFNDSWKIITGTGFKI